MSRRVKSASRNREAAWAEGEVRSQSHLAARRMRAMMTNIHVFHCSEVECRWARGVEYTDETADESLEAAAGMCALDGRLKCPQHCRSSGPSC